MRQTKPHAGASLPELTLRCFCLTSEPGDDSPVQANQEHVRLQHLRRPHHHVRGASRASDAAARGFQSAQD